MHSQSGGSPSCWNFGTPTWESRDKKPFGCGHVESYRVYYMGEGDGFPRVRAVVRSCESRVARGCPSTKGAPESDLTNWVVGLMHV
jgi:hypothetical protein